MKTKICFKCKNNLPLSMFYKHSKMADGHLNKCKECAKVDVRVNRKCNLEYYRDYDKQRGFHGRNGYIKEYRSRYPRKYRATSMVNSAIKSGRLYPEPCCVCGSPEFTHAHHDDYSKPLNVRWLCPVHHKQWHDINGEGLNGS